MPLRDIVYERDGGDYVIAIAGVQCTYTQIGILEAKRIEVLIVTVKLSDKTREEAVGAAR